MSMNDATLLKATMDNEDEKNSMAPFFSDRRPMRQRIQDKLQEIEKATEKLNSVLYEIKRLTDDIREIRSTNDDDAVSLESSPSLSTSSSSQQQQQQKQYVLGDEFRHVEHLIQEFQFTIFFKWKDALDFVNECIGLRCNDPTVTKIQPRGLAPPIYYGHVLGNCLRYNTHVTDLTLNMRTMFGPYDHTATEFRYANVEYLLDYVEKSTVLRRVRLDGDFDAPHATALGNFFLEAAGRNHNITELDCNLQIAPVSFYNVLNRMDNSQSDGTIAVQTQTKCSITKLSINCCHWNIFEQDQKVPTMLQSLRKNTSVVDLTLTTVDHHWMTLMFALVHDGSLSQVQKLSLSFDIQDELLDHMSLLTHYLEHTKTLQYLKFGHCELDIDRIYYILEGLRRHYSRATSASAPTIKKLSLIYCTLDEESLTDLVQFLQTPTTELFGNNNGSGVLQEVKIRICEEQEGLSKMMVDNVRIGAAMASIITPKNSVTTIGSQLQVLTVHPFGCMVGFCETVLPHVDDVQISCLRLSYLGLGDIEQLTTCLPYLPSLQQLHLTMIEDSVPLNDVLLLIQQCGHLQSVTALDDRHQPLLNDQQSLLAQSFCDRNRVLLQIRSGRMNSVDFMKSSYLADNCAHAAKRLKTVDCHIGNTIWLLPMLLHVAKQVPTTTYLHTTLSVLSSFGYDGLSSGKPDLLTTTSYNSATRPHSH